MVEFNPRDRLWTLVGSTGQTHGICNSKMQHRSQWGKGIPKIKAAGAVRLWRWRRSKTRNHSTIKKWCASFTCYFAHWKHTEALKTIIIFRVQTSVLKCTPLMFTQMKMVYQFDDYTMLDHITTTTVSLKSKRQNVSISYVRLKEMHSLALALFLVHVLLD